MNKYGHLVAPRLTLRRLSLPALLTWLALCCETGSISTDCAVLLSALHGMQPEMKICHRAVC